VGTGTKGGRGLIPTCGLSGGQRQKGRKTLWATGELQKLNRHETGKGAKKREAKKGPPPRPIIYCGNLSTGVKKKRGGGRTKNSKRLKSTSGVSPKSNGGSKKNNEARIKIEGGHKEVP